MAFKDHGEALLRGVDPKRLPYKGTWYEFPRSISARTGLLLARIRDKAYTAVRDGGAQSLDELDMDEDMLDSLGDADQSELRAEILGEAYPRLIEDGVPEAVVDHMESTLVIWHLTGSQEAAEEAWNEVGGPKAPADRKAKKSSGSTARRTTRSAKPTRQQGSTGATNPSDSKAISTGRSS